MPEIIAFEGNPAAALGVTWGAAAIRDGERVVNSITGAVTSLREVDLLIRQQTLVRLPTPKPIEGGSNGYVVVSIDPHSPLYGHIAVFPGDASLRVNDESGLFQAFTSIQQYENAIERFSSEILKTVINQVWDETIADTLVRACLTLAPTHPELNALWAFRERYKPLALRVATQNVIHGHGSLADFYELYNGLKATLANDWNQRIEWEYNGGDADRHGFSLPINLSVAAGMNYLFSQLAIETQKHKSYLAPIPPPIVRERLAACVRWTLSLTQGDEPFGEVLGKVLVWQRVLHILRTGEIPIADSLHHTYEILLSPAPGSRLTVRYHGESIQPHELGQNQNPLRWAKQLSRSDAQVPTTGGPIPYLRLTRSVQNVPFEWFRNEFFAGSTWHPGGPGEPWHTGEFTHVDFDITINGLPLGRHRLLITDDAQRPLSLSHPPTWLHWGEFLASMLRSSYYAKQWVTMERRSNHFFLAIDVAAPHWAR